MNASVRTSSATRSASRSAASDDAARRTGAPFSPVYDVSGGSHRRQRDLPARRGVVGDRRHVQTSQPSGGHGRIGHRRRRQDERRLGAVQRADPAQPAQHVRHVRTEHAAVVVALVDDDVLQRTEEPRPPAVPRQQRTVQHVGVGQDVLAVVAGPVPLLARAVAVVGGHPHVEPQRHQPCQLVLGQRLGGREVEHARATLTAGASSAADRGQRGELVGQRLPGGGPGREHDVVTGVRGVGGRDLVPPRALDPACGVGRPQLVGDPARPVGDTRLPGWQHLEVGEPVGPPGDPRQAVDEVLHGKPSTPSRAVHGLSLANCRDTPSGGPESVTMRCPKKKTSPS